MNLANAIDASITKNATSLELLKQALTLINKKSKKGTKQIDKRKFFNKFQDLSRKGGKKPKRLKQLGKLLAGSGYLGLSGVGKKRNAVIRGGVLGAAAGLFSVLSNADKSEGTHANTSGQAGNTEKLLTVTCYTLGGLAIGTLIKHFHQNKRLQKWAKKNKAYLKDSLRSLNVN